MFSEKSYEDGNLFKRRGMFNITDAMLRQEPYAVQLLMSEVIITDCIFNYNNNMFEYWAISPHFKEIPNNQLAPKYRPIVDRITKSEDLDPDYIEYKVKFEKQ